jgi:CIC family chloride channel protein
MDDRRWPKPALFPLSFFFLAVLIGIVAGLGAVAFRGLIAFFHNLLFLGRFSFVYDANIHTPASPWGPLVILVPVIGAFGVVFLVKNFAPEAKGRGVPEVMDAIYYNKGIIRPVVALIKSLASALSIGSGGSVGREGPIIQIASSFGSTVGQILRMPVWQRITLIAAGTGGGIAATFNTPIGGMLFALEITLQEISVKTLVPLAISTITATYVGRIFFGVHPSFVIPAFETPYFHLGSPLVLVFYAGLGIVMGAISAVYIKSIHGFEDFFENHIRGSYYKRHMFGMILVGIMMYLLMVTLGHYYIEGVGYSTVQDVLTGHVSQLYLLLLLFILKLFATSLSLGSGASGGIFSPSLFMGATLGGVYGIIVHHLFPGLNVTPPAFAVAGMAGMVGGTTGAALAAIVMIFEMTFDYSVIIPVTLTVALSYGVRTLLSRESIYTVNLARRGHIIPESLRADFQQLKRARDAMDSHVMALPASRTLEEFARTARGEVDISWFLVEEANRIIGVVARDAAAGAVELSRRAIPLGKVADKNYIVVAEETMLLDVISRMRSHQASVALVTRRKSEPFFVEDVTGLITKAHIGDIAMEAPELFSH